MSVEAAPRWRRRAAADYNDRYCVLLAVALVGYAVMGKGLAYVGIAPLYVSEIVLFLGLLAFLRTRWIVAVLTTGPTLLAALLLLWVMARTIPYIAAYKVDALRDSVIGIYALFAFITIALIGEKPARLGEAIRFLGAFTAFYGAIAFVLYYLSRAAAELLPVFPGSPVPIIFVRSGEVAVHVSAAATFALLGLRRVGLLWIMLVVAGAVIVSAQSRGGMLAILGPVFLGLLLSGRVGIAGGFGLVVAGVLGLAHTLDLSIDLAQGPRNLSAQQIFQNFGSIFSSSADMQLDGTKMWRVRWWEAIKDYTLNGEYFWTGKGFGINLAEADGFSAGQSPGEPPLRSPHNGNMTILARAGVPGLALWVAMLVSWCLRLLKDMLVARQRGEREWAHFFLFLICYLLALLINASFDVTLEAPMLGIWFWVLFGLGVAASMVYREHAARDPASPPYA